jgi:hypothetical protein
MMGMQDKTITKNFKQLRNPGIQLFRSTIFWDQYIKNFKEISEPAIYHTICDLLLQRDLPMNENDMVKYINESNREKYIESITIRLMGTPQYQLC